MKQRADALLGAAHLSKGFAGRCTVLTAAAVQGFRFQVLLHKALG